MPDEANEMNEEPTEAGTESDVLAEVRRQWRAEQKARKEAEKAAQEARDQAADIEASVRAQVARENEARQALVTVGYEGLADVYLSHLGEDGEIDTASVASFLEARGLPAQAKEQPTPSDRTNLTAASNLGQQIAAAAGSGGEVTVEERINAVDGATLDEVTAQVAAIAAEGGFYQG